MLVETTDERQQQVTFTLSDLSHWNSLPLPLLDISRSVHLGINYNYCGPVL